MTYKIHIHFKWYDITLYWKKCWCNYIFVAKSGDRKVVMISDYPNRSELVLWFLG